MASRDESTQKPPVTFDPHTPEITGVRVAPMDEERQAVVALSERLGVPGIDVRTVPLTLADLDAVPRDLARRHAALVLLAKDDVLLVAMADPGNRQALDELEFVTGRRVFPYAADAEAVRDLVERAYDLRARGATELPAEHSASSPPPQGTRPSSPGIAVRSDRPATLPPPLQRRSRQATIVGAPTQPPPLPGFGSSAPRRERDSSPPAFVAPPLAPPAAPAVVAPAPALAPVPAAPSSRPAAPPPARPASPPRAFRPQPPSLTKPVPRESSVSGLDRTALALVPDAAARAALDHALQALGVALTVSSSVQEFVAAAAASPPTLLVLDTEVPDGHGVDVLLRLRAKESTAEVPVLVTTAEHPGWRFERDLQEQYGVRALLARPLSPAEVVLRVRAVLRPDDDLDALPEAAEEAQRKSTEAWQRGELGEAVSWLERAVQEAPDSYRLYYHLGLALGRRGDLFRAIRAVERSVALHGTYFPSLKNLAVLYERASFRHKALESWERAFGVAPDDATRDQIRERVIALL